MLRLTFRPGGTIAAVLLALIIQCHACAAPVLETLPSGLRVIVSERTEKSAPPLVAIDLRVRAGTAFETTADNGVAHFVEHLVFKGTQTRSRGAIDAAMNLLGGELSAHTTADATRYETLVPPPNWRAALAILADMVLRPAFRPNDIETERRVILSEMASAFADPLRVAQPALAGLVYPAGHPYAHTLYGPEANVQRFGQNDLRAFWRARYAPANMTLVVVGDVVGAEVIAAARELFPASETPSAAAPPLSFSAPALPSGPRRAAPIRHDRRLSTMALAFDAPAGSARADVVAFDVLLAILSKGRGRLPAAVLTQSGLAVRASADYLTQRGPGLLIVWADAYPDDASRVEKELAQAMKRLVEDGVSEREVEAAKAVVLGQHWYDRETVEGEARLWAFYDVVDDWTFAQQYAELVKRVDPEAVNGVARRYLGRGGVPRAVVLVAPAARREGEQR